MQNKKENQTAQKATNSKEYGNEFRVRGVNSRLKEEIKNIAKYYDMDTSMFIKMLLRKTADSFPDNVKNGDAE